MATLQLTAAQVVLNHADIKSSVISYVGSKEYLTKIVPLSITNLLYYRTNISRNLFRPRQLKEFKFVTFNSDIKNILSKSINSSLISAMESLNESYLKELFFIIVKKGTQEVLEIYKYKFSYNEDSVKTGTNPSSDQVLEYTINFFNGIKELKRNSIIEDDIDYKIELTYTDDTPQEYEPPNFTATEGQPLLKQYKEKKSYLALGKIDTGFHMLKCFGISNIMDISRPVTPISNVEISDEDYDELARANLNLNGTIVSVSDRDLESPVLPNQPVLLTQNANIKCLCNLQHEFKNIPLITCSECKSAQHSPCMKYFELKPADDYKCLQCSPDMSRTDEAQALCLTRLILVYAYHSNSADDIIYQLEVSEQNSICKKLKQLQIFQFENNSYVISSPRKLKGMLRHMFKHEMDGQKKRPIDSMVLQPEHVVIADLETPEALEDDSLNLPKEPPKKKRSSRKPMKYL